MRNEEMRLLPAAAYAQSCVEGHEAGRAIDYREDTSWKAGPYYQWLLIDLEENCFVSSIHVRFAPIEGYYHYHIEYSTDRMNWLLLTENTMTPRKNRKEKHSRWNSSAGICGSPYPTAPFRWKLRYGTSASMAVRRMRQ